MTAAGGLVALDVALFVPEPLRQPCVYLNARLAPPLDGFRFDDSHLAHVSVVQQFVKHEHLDDIRQQVVAVVAHTTPLMLEATEIKAGRTTSVLGLVLTPELERLHRALMDRLAVFDTGRGDGDAFVAGDEPARSADVRWVERFRTEAAYDRFDPHITLGVGALPRWTGPARARSHELALCHLGRFCTCRRVLAQWTLTP